MNINYKEKFYKIRVPIILMMALISVIAMTMSLDNLELEKDTVAAITVFKIKLYASLPELDISYLFVFVFIYYFYNKFYFKGTKVNKSIVILSVFFSLSLIFGYSFSKVNSWDWVFCRKDTNYKKHCEMPRLLIYDIYSNKRNV